MKKIEFRRLALVAALAVLAAQATAQEARPQERQWTLGECIEYARSNNIQVRKAQINASAGEVELEAAKASRYPTLSFNSGQSVSHQSAIKLINDYGEVVSDGTFSYGGSYGFGSNVSIFQGGRLRNSVRQQIPR